MEVISKNFTEKKIPLIYNIQRYSLQDGPGIRTTIFLKGCPLKCPWCHNPDSQDTKREILYDTQKCRACGACVQACPSGATRWEGPAVILDRKICSGCGQCVDICPVNAREWSGKEMVLEDIVRVAKEDEMFYMSSDGGVTISGGDPLYFPEFTTELARRLKEEMLHVTIDTAAFCHWSSLDGLRKYADLFLIDLKTMSSEKYRDVIGASLSIVKDNLEKLTDKGAAVRVRIPVIPGFNDREEDFIAFGAYLQRIGKRLQGVDILPFHAYADKKYKMLGRWEKYQFSKTESLQPEDLKGLAVILKQAGFSPADARLTIGGIT